MRPAGLPGALPGGEAGPADPADPSAPSGPSDPSGPIDPFGLAGPAEPATLCGPELSSPAGVEAQTCVLRQEHDTWARTYYRNTTGGPLEGVLTLMAPDGRTVEVRCQLAASDDPGTCETPHAPTAPGHGSYAAVAEIATTEGKLLLRSGSNSAADARD
ncbi:hypothetical protein AB0K09_30410 [Streptomyces sp. NPDC049577]|uniref:hypothetical protein n=1 Tax=Streptomyces sp. NPDC049577 TaxID=3155153 RepID=UPI00341B4501